MSVSTTRFFDTNSALFSKINDELKSLQGQVGTGEAELTLAKDIRDISKLSAADEKKSETNQFLSNSKRVQSDLEFLDVAFNVVGIKDWSDYIKQDPRFMRPAEVDVLRGDATKADKHLNWKCKTSFKDLVSIMVNNDIERLERKHGTN